MTYVALVLVLMLLVGGPILFMALVQDDNAPHDED